MQLGPTDLGRARRCGLRRSCLDCESVGRRNGGETDFYFDCGGNRKKAMIYGGEGGGGIWRELGDGGRFERQR